MLCWDTEAFQVVSALSEKDVSAPMPSLAAAVVFKALRVLPHPLSAVEIMAHNKPTVVNLGETRGDTYRASWDIAL